MTGNTVATWVADLDMWPLIVVLVLNLLFRRYGGAGGYKRMASLYQAIMIFLITTAAAVSISLSFTKDQGDLYFFLAVVIIVVAGVMLRKRVFPYRRTCVECDAKLDIETIYFRDANLCNSCREAEQARKDAEAAGEEIESTGVTESGDESWPGAGNNGIGNETDPGDQEKGE